MSCCKQKVKRGFNIKVGSVQSSVSNFDLDWIKMRKSILKINVKSYIAVRIHDPCVTVKPD